MRPLQEERIGEREYDKGEERREEKIGSKTYYKGEKRRPRVRREEDRKEERWT